MGRPIFYYDISSAYAYMAAERIGKLIPDADWRPILLGGLFKLNGRSSWLFSDEREPRMAEIAQRAAGYGLPPLRWPIALPASLLDLARAATVAKREERALVFSLAAFRCLYVEGRDPSQPDELRRLAVQTGLDPETLLGGIQDQAVKDLLRSATEEAHAHGAPGVPTVVVEGEVFWGDDRLDEAAHAAGARATTRRHT